MSELRRAERSEGEPRRCFEGVEEEEEEEGEEEEEEEVQEEEGEEEEEEDDEEVVVVPLIRYASTQTKQRS